MPSGSLRGYVEHYFAPHPTQQVRELFLSSAILNFAVSAISLFEPLYLHSIGFSIPKILLFYAALYVLYFFMLPLGGRICRRHGYEHTILFSSPFLILWYISLFAIPWHPAFAVVALVALVFQKILYWPGYHSNFATFSTKSESGREVSNMAAIAGLAAVVAPAVGGAVIAAFGYKTLIAGVAILILLSNIPLLRTPELYEPKSFDYGDALARPFQKKNRTRTAAFFGFGEELIALVAWPLFMATVITSLTSLGVVVSLAMLLNVVAILYVGRISDEGDPVSVLRSGAFYDVASWIIRPLTSGGLGVFLMDSFYRVSKNMLGLPLVALMYQEARDGVTMESVVHFEMSLSLGKAVAAVAAAAILWKWPTAWTAVFILAGIFAAFYAFMPRRVLVAAVESSNQ